MHREPDIPTKPAAAGGGLRSQLRVFALLVLGVVVLHALALKGLAQALAGVQASTATGPVFMARTLVLDTPPQPNTPLPAPEPPEQVRAPQAAPPPPVQAAAPAAVPAATEEAPVAAQDAGTVVAQRHIEPPPSVPPSLAAADFNMAPSGGAMRSFSAGQPDYDYAVPGSVRLKYRGSGSKGILSLPVSAELLWSKDGKAYDARLELGFLGFSRVQTSKGAVGPRGLEPLRFGDKTRSEEAAHFQRAKGIVSFSGNGPDAPLMPLAQDLLSVYVQLAAMWGANPARFSPGMQLPFQLVEKHRSGSRVFTVGATERLKVEGREMVATRLVCDPSADYDNRVELWLAPALEYLPARIRMTQANGDEVDIFWSSTEKP